MCAKEMMNFNLCTYIEVFQINMQRLLNFEKFIL